MPRYTHRVTTPGRASSATFAADSMEHARHIAHLQPHVVTIDPSISGGEDTIYLDEVTE